MKALRKVVSGWSTCWCQLVRLNPESDRRCRIFSDIYAQKAWGDGESASGPGSNFARAILFRDDLERLIRDLRVRTLLDAPCGDFNWLSRFDLAVDRYIGVDIVPELILGNREKFGGKQRDFRRLDIVSDRLPRADLIFCRDGLVHLSNAEVLSTLRNFKSTGSTWLLTNTVVEHANNENILTGSWQPLNLQAPPFSLPAPAHLLDERCVGYGGVYRDKRLGLWRLEDIRC